MGTFLLEGLVSPMGMGMSQIEICRVFLFVFYLFFNKSIMIRHDISGVIEKPCLENCACGLRRPKRSLERAFKLLGTPSDGCVQFGDICSREQLQEVG